MPDLYNNIKHLTFAHFVSLHDRLINDAYAVEYGDTGVAFKTSTSPRISDPREDWLLEAYNIGNMIKAVDSTGDIVGAIYIKQEPEKLFFGPFGVRVDMKGTGIGKLLLQEVVKIGNSWGAKYIEINVVNWRTDVIPMYEKMGFEKVGEEDFPHPEVLTRPVRIYVYRKPLDASEVVASNNNATAPEIVPVVASTTSAKADAPKSVLSFGKKAAAVMKEAPAAATSSAAPRSPWMSINDMLIQNRCWLCEQVFARGKQKKVFQVSNLLDFFSERLKAQDAPALTTSSSAGNASGVDSIAMDVQVDGVTASEGVADGVAVAAAEPVVDVSAPMHSKHLTNCYDSFVRLVRADPVGEKNLMRQEFIDSDVEVWMSGLVCGVSAECQRDLQLFIKSAVIAGAGSASSTLAGGSLMNSSDCPPGCNCDNPWPFLA